MSSKKPAPDSRTIAVSVAVFARSVDMSENAIHNLIARGDLAGVRLGRAKRIPVTEFDRLGLPAPNWAVNR